jgi:hypothetical protein
MASSSGSRRTPCRISSTSAKLICRAAARATAQLLLRCTALARALQDLLVQAGPRSRFP